MNIPMAYDAVPVDPAHNGGMVNPAYGSHMTSVIVGNNNMHHQSNHASMPASLDAPLLLNDQEAEWAQEMQQEGIGHLPVSWYRQTPKQAVWGGYGVINRVISALVNFGINVGLGYAILKGNDQVGLWKEPTLGDHPYKSAAIGDFYITTLFICFLTTLFSTGGIRSAMKKGQVVPVDEALLRGGVWRCMPVNILGTLSRSLLLSAWGCLFVCTPFLAGMEIVCAAGGMNGSGSDCSMGQEAYIYLKAVFAMILAFIIYPIVLLMTLNTHTLPPLDLTFFVQNQREKWDKQQREKAPEPL